MDIEKILHTENDIMDIEIPTIKIKIPVRYYSLAREINILLANGIEPTISGIFNDYDKSFHAKLLHRYFHVSRDRIRKEVNIKLPLFYTIFSAKAIKYEIPFEDFVTLRNCLLSMLKEEDFIIGSTDNIGAKISALKLHRYYNMDENEILIKTGFNVNRKDK